MFVILIRRDESAEIVKTGSGFFVPGNAARIPSPNGNTFVDPGDFRQADFTTSDAIFGTQVMLGQEFPVLVEVGTNPQRIPYAILALLAREARVGRPDRGTRPWT